MSDEIDLRELVARHRAVHGSWRPGAARDMIGATRNAEEESWNRLERRVAAACREAARLANEAGVGGAGAMVEVEIPRRLFRRGASRAVKRVVSYDLEWGPLGSSGCVLLRIHPDKDPEWLVPDESERAQMGSYVRLRNPLRPNNHEIWRDGPSGSWVNGIWVQDQVLIPLEEQQTAKQRHTEMVLVEFLCEHSLAM